MVRFYLSVFALLLYLPYLLALESGHEENDVFSLKSQLLVGEMMSTRDFQSLSTGMARFLSGLGLYTFELVPETRCQTRIL